MKNIYFLSVVILLASCSGVNQLAYRKSGFKLKKSEASETFASTPVSSEKPILAAAFVPAEITPDVPASKAEIVPVTIPVRKAEIEPQTIRREAGSEIVSEDSVVTEPAASPEIVRQAFQAEEQARKSQAFGISGFVLTILPILFPLGMVLSIIGLSNGRKALQSSYITENGLRMARRGFIFSLLSLVITILVIILLVSLILILI